MSDKSESSIPGEFSPLIRHRRSPHLDSRRDLSQEAIFSLESLIAELKDARNVDTVAAPGKLYELFGSTKMVYGSFSDPSLTSSNSFQ